MRRHAQAVEGSAESAQLAAIDDLETKILGNGKIVWPEVEGEDLIGARGKALLVKLEIVRLEADCVAEVPFVVIILVIVLIIVVIVVVEIIIVIVVEFIVIIVV